MNSDTVVEQPPMCIPKEMVNPDIVVEHHPVCIPEIVHPNIVVEQPLIIRLMCVPERW